jgi:hypothetical protein|eukprot:COSAG01_NODE_1828_length_9126_cov_53.025479_12_plen_136_part_00
MSQWFRSFFEAAGAASSRRGAAAATTGDDDAPRARPLSLQKTLERYRRAVAVDNAQAPIDTAALRQLAAVGIPEELRLRGLYWKLLLGYLPADTSAWETVLRERRQEYQRYRASFHHAAVLHECCSAQGAASALR